MVLANSTVFTLAGGLERAEAEAGGAESCPPPCLRGVAGHTDGNLTEARRDSRPLLAVKLRGVTPPNEHTDKSDRSYEPLKSEGNAGPEGLTRITRFHRLPIEVPLCSSTYV